ncbi:MAG: EscJ/YscJ/HrcJ family type III secretion inner membrane ring protein [Simkania sp.]|nr:EscJ/YscJ/HrcJ family type III secretion inner membrane ring protein [Simkania sp.]
MIRSLTTLKKLFFFFPFLLLLVACQSNMVIINNVEEREANEIVVFLASRNIAAMKVASSGGGPTGGGGPPSLLFNIAVDTTRATEAMALLNQNGLPRIKGTNLLELFAKQGLMSSDKEETIRYQAGLAAELAGMIRKIDGIIDAEVELAFPPPDTGIGGGNQPKQKVSASVYVKHQGVLDDPNSHLVTKIKRLVSASVTGLDINDVTVIPDRARFAEITLDSKADSLAANPKEYVSIWSIVMNKQSASKFRFLFFTLTFAFLVFAIMAGWLIWKFYPILRKQGGWRQLLDPKPMKERENPPREDE